MPLICLLWLQIAFAASVPNVAIIPFTGDQSLRPEQLTLITGKFSGELLSTGLLTVLDREKMDFILKEQGFQQSGACDASECRVQMGQLLGVDYLISGSLVQMGSEFALHLETIDVGSGQIVKIVDVDEEGSLQDTYKNLSRRGALQLAETLSGKSTGESGNGGENLRVVPQDAIPQGPKSTMSLKRKIAIALWGGSLGGLGTGLYFNKKAEGYADDFDDAENVFDEKKMKAAESDIDGAKMGRNISYGVSAGTAVLGLVLWFLPERK